MTKTDFDILASRAVKPAFYEAPHPPLDKLNGMVPMPFQHSGVEYMLGRDNGIIGDPPGLTKTAQAIMLSNAIGAKSNLAVVPASLRLNWEREIWRWSTIENVTTYPVLKASDGVSLRADWTIISYDLLRNPAIHAALMDHRWDHLVLDEAHALKDPKGNQRTKAICGWNSPDGYVPGLADVAGRKTLLSGTLLPNQPIECLGPNTLVLTDSGWKAIINVEQQDNLWDGDQWVRHQGLVYRGKKKTGRYLGVQMTSDHLVLVGANWCGAKNLGDESTRLRALAIGSENLPWSVSNSGPLAAFWPSMCAAIAGPVRSIKQAKRIYGAECTAVVLAGLLKVFGRGIKNTSALAPTLNYASACVGASATSSLGVTTPTILATAPTAVAASESRKFGAKTELSFWRILRLCLGAKMLRWRLTVSTWMATTRPATFVSRRGEKVSGARYSNCNSASTILSDVYDLVNAGPSHRFTILSSGGPLVVHNCYNAIRLCNHAAIDNASLDSFREHYYDFGGGMIRGRVYDQQKQAWKYKLHYSQNVRNVPKNLDDLQCRLRKFIMVRRNKSDVLPWLPKLRWHPFPLSTTPEMRRALKHPGWLAAERLYELDPAAFDHGIPVDGAISTAREELGIAKAPAVADYIEQLMEEGVEKLIVAAWHHSVLDYLRGRLKHYGLVYMDGSTSSVAKQKAVDDFQSKDDIGIILGQAMPLCQGWTLTAAQDCVNAEPDWVPGNNEQLGDRICRMGQTGDSLTIHVPVVPGTLDEKIMGTAIDKGINTHAALDKVA